MSRFRKILLINPPISLGKNKMPYMPPASLGYVTEALERDNIEYDFIDMLLGYGFNYLARKIRENRYDLVGISVWTLLYKETYKFIHKVKNEFPQIKIIVGGPHISTIRDKVLEECTAIDFGVTLEGEETVLELCRGVDYNQTKGLIYREGNRVVYTGDRLFISDLDKIGFPKYSKFELKKYVTKNIGIISSRGCPYNCTYCPVTTTMGRRFNARSAHSVVTELSYWYARGYRQFQILDDNFTLRSERVYEICNLIEDSSFTDLHLSLPNGVRADRINYDLLKRMREIGFNEIAFGVESGNDKVLKNINKAEKIEVIERAIKNACDLDYRVILFFIIGSPGETWDDFMDSINLALKYPVFSARFYNLIPFPRTKLFEYVKSHNYFLRQPEEYLNNSLHTDDKPVFETPELSYKERVDAYHLGETTHRKVVRKYFTNIFKKYGMVGRVVAFLISTKIFLNIYWNNIMVRQISGWVRKYI